ncbi:MAG: hypothetical protein ACK481_10050 [Candidatus Melainabacteria bacterium]
MSNSLLPLPTNARHGSKHLANQNVSHANKNNSSLGSSLTNGINLNNSSDDNTNNQATPKTEQKTKQNFFQEILSYIPETKESGELFKSIVKLLVAYIAFKSAPWLKDKFVQAKFTNKLKDGIQSKAEKIVNNTKVQGLKDTVKEGFKEGWDRNWEKLGYKFNLKDFLPDPAAFFTDPIVLLASGYVGGSVLFGIFNQLLPSTNNNLDKDATHKENQAGANNKKTHSRNLFQKFFDALVKLGVAGFGLHWMGKKFNHNPIAELAGLIGGFGLGQLINGADEWLTNKVEDFVKPIVNSLTGLKEESPDLTNNTHQSNWSFANAIAGAISMSLLFFIKFLILLPKKKALVYKFSFEPNKGIKNEALRSTLKFFHAQASIVGTAFGLKLGTVLPEPPEMPRDALPSTNLEHGINWCNSLWPLTKEHIDQRVQEMEIPGFAKPLVKMSATTFYWSYLKKISLWGDAVRCKNFSEVMESSPNPAKSAIAQAMVKDGQGNIFAKILLMPFIAGIFFTTDLLTNFIVNPFVELFKSLFGLKDKETITKSHSKPSLSQQIHLAGNHR